MKTNKNKLSGWSFQVDEVSAGGYRALAEDRFGRKVDLTGTDPDKLLEECKQAAQNIELSSTDKKRNQ